MNTKSASPAERPRTLVWDAPVRVFHWLMVLCFPPPPGSPRESERWQLLHITAGYTMAGLVAFRVLWGLMGTRHARFTDFVRGPRAVGAYLKLAGEPAAGAPRRATTRPERSPSWPAGPGGAGDRHRLGHLQRAGGE